MERQRSKYEALVQQKLGGCSSPTLSGTTEETRKWVINLSDQPLTEEQEKILARGQNLS